MTNEEIRNIILNNGYVYVELTSGVNGYPKNLHPVAIGFEDYNDALLFANKTGGAVIQIRQRYGWDLWERHGYATGMIDLAEVYEDESIWYRNTVHDYETEEDLIAEISYLFEDCKTFAEYRELLDEYENLWDAMEELEGSEEMIIHHGSYNEKVNRWVTEYEYDSSRYKIAVEL